MNARSFNGPRTLISKSLRYIHGGRNASGFPIPAAVPGIHISSASFQMAKKDGFTVPFPATCIFAKPECARLPSLPCSGSRKEPSTAENSLRPSTKFSSFQGRNFPLTWKDHKKVFSFQYIFTGETSFPVEEKQRRFKCLTAPLKQLPPAGRSLQKRTIPQMNTTGLLQKEFYCFIYRKSPP